MELTLNVDKFDGKKFRQWKFQIKCALKAKGIDISIQRTEANANAWLKNDGMAMYVITSSMDLNQITLIENCETALEIMSEAASSRTIKMSLVGSIEPFKPGESEISSYIERMEQLFLCNNMEEEKKVPLFLTLVGGEAYSVIKDLISPELPSSRTYVQLKNVLLAHYCPKKLIIAERYQFYMCTQESSENMNAFIIKLKKLSKHCNFGQFLDDALRDKLVCGLKSENVKKKLLSEENLTFSKACQIAQSMELAENKAKIMGIDLVNKVESQSHFRSRFKQTSSGPVRSGSSQSMNMKCKRCLRLHMNNSKCPAMQWKCFSCNTIGHTSKSPMCKNRVHFVEEFEGDFEDQNLKAKQENSDNAEEEVFYSIIKGIEEVHQSSNGKTSPVMIKLSVEGKIIEFELDTGSDSSIVSMELFKKFFPTVELVKDNVKLKTLFGQVNDLVFKATVDVKCLQNGCSKSLELKVIDFESDVSLLGRSWLNVLMPNWREKFECFDTMMVNNSVCSNEVEDFIKILKNEYENVFNQNKCIKGFVANVKVRDNVTPKFCKPYRIPYALKDRVREEIENLVKEGILQPVEMSEWASPIVVVPKPNGKIRICGDFKSTINPVIENQYYPLPTAEEIFASLSGGKLFSVVDLKNAYFQIEVSDESKRLLTINTPSGLFSYTRLAFGVKSAPHIFQSVIEQILKNISGVHCYLDDCLITAENHQEMENRLKLVFDRFKKYNVRINLDKSNFFLKKVTFLGHIISEKGIEPTDQKIKAILEAPKPENVQQLQSYLGLLHYYSNFIPKLSEKLIPLYKLLQKGVSWYWNRETDTCFETSKKFLLGSNILMAFNPIYPITLTCDASPYGIGSILAHVLPDGSERPVMYVSATLSSAEKNYSQLEKEALSIIHGVKKFHNYLYGRKFTLINDHKPLQYLLSPSKPLPPLAAARVQRWAVILSGYDYEIKHKEGKKLPHVDALSRLPLKSESSGETIKYFSIVKELPISFRDIAKETLKDNTLRSVKDFILYGWPISNKNPDLLPYFRIREYLNLDQGCITYNNRVLIPKHLQQRVLCLLHDQHPGVVKMKMVARQYVYWNNLNKDIEDLVKQCECCQLNAKNVPEAPLTSWSWCTRKWQRLHLDLAKKNDINFLILIDAHSKWIDAWILRSTNASNIISCLRQSFAVFGLPDEIHTDNGPPFNSEDFILFCTSNGVKVLKSPPLHPSSNGITERCIQTFKNNFLKQIYDDKTKCLTNQEKLDNFLFFYRNIPHSVTQLSPAELMLKQKPKTKLSLLKPNLNGYIKDKQTYIIEKRNKNIHPNRFKEFQEEDEVYVKNVRGEKDNWSKGIVKVRVSPVTYIVLVGDKPRYVHIDHLRKVSTLSDDFASVENNSSYDVDSGDILFSEGRSKSSNSENENKLNGDESCENDVQCADQNERVLMEKSNDHDNNVENSLSENPTTTLRRSVRTIKKPDRYMF